MLTYLQGCLRHANKYLKCAIKSALVGFLFLSFAPSSYGQGGTQVIYPTSPLTPQGPQECAALNSQFSELRRRISTNNRCLKRVEFGTYAQCELAPDGNYKIAQRWGAYAYCGPLNAKKCELEQKRKREVSTCKSRLAKLATKQPLQGTQRGTSSELPHSTALANEHTMTSVFGTIAGNTFSYGLKHMDNEWATDGSLSRNWSRIGNIQDLWSIGETGFKNPATDIPAVIRIFNRAKANRAVFGNTGYAVSATLTNIMTNWYLTYFQQQIQNLNKVVADYHADIGRQNAQLERDYASAQKYFSPEQIAYRQRLEQKRIAEQRERERQRKLAAQREAEQERERQRRLAEERRWERERQWERERREEERQRRQEEEEDRRWREELAEEERRNERRRQNNQQMYDAFYNLGRAIGGASGSSSTGSSYNTSKKRCETKRTNNGFECYCDGSFKYRGACSTR